MRLRVPVLIGFAAGLLLVLLSIVLCSFATQIGNSADSPPRILCNSILRWILLTGPCLTTAICHRTRPSKLVTYGVGLTPWLLALVVIVAVWP